MITMGTSCRVSMFTAITGVRQSVNKSRSIRQIHPRVDKWEKAAQYLPCCVLIAKELGLWRVLADNLHQRTSEDQTSTREKFCPPTRTREEKRCFRVPDGKPSHYHLLLLKIISSSENNKTHKTFLEWKRRQELLKQMDNDVASKHKTAEQKAKRDFQTSTDRTVPLHAPFS